MFLGSVKPYAFDAYLGVLAKTVVDESASGAARSSLSDPLLIGVFAIFLGAGALASELATQAGFALTRSWTVRTCRSASTTLELV